MTREEFRAKWSTRRVEWEKLGVLVSGANLCEEFIADFEDVLTSHDEAVLNTNQAAAMTGYSRAQLLHLYKQGKLRGHKNGKHVFFREGDLPRKPRGGRQVVLEAGATGGKAGSKEIAEPVPIEGSCPCGTVSQGQLSRARS